MKKSLLLILVFSSFIFTNSHAQCFAKGDKVVSAGIMLGIYNTSISDYNTKKDTTGRAGAVIYPFTFEYGITDRIGGGLLFSYDHYLSSPDSAGVKTTANAEDIAALANFHFVKRKKTDLYAGLAFGYSHLALYNNDVNQGTYKASGTYFGINTGAHFYFGSHFGLMLNFAYTMRSYPHGQTSDKYGNTDHLNFKLSGTNWGTGFMVRF